MPGDDTEVQMLRRELSAIKRSYDKDMPELQALNTEQRTAIKQLLEEKFGFGPWRHRYFTAQHLQTSFECRGRWLAAAWTRRERVEHWLSDIRLVWHSNQLTQPNPNYYIGFSIILYKFLFIKIIFLKHLGFYLPFVFYLTLR